MPDAGNLQLLHNPRCSKSRAALALLREHGAEPEIRLYLDDPLDRDALAGVLAALDTPASTLIRAGDARKAGLTDAPAHMNAERIADWLAAHPQAMQRPVLLRGDGRAVIGRPPERVLTLLEQTR